MAKKKLIPERSGYTVILDGERVGFVIQIRRRYWQAKSSALPHDMFFSTLTEASDVICRAVAKVDAKPVETNQTTEIVVRITKFGRPEQVHRESVKSLGKALYGTFGNLAKMFDSEGREIPYNPKAHAG